MKYDEKECDKKFDASEVDLEGLGLESCSDCECANERARKVVNSLLVDAAGSDSDITVSPSRDRLEVWLHAEDDEKLFDLPIEAFSAIASYLASLRDGNVIEFEAGPRMRTRFWCEIDDEEREVSIVNQGDVIDGVQLSIDIPSRAALEIEAIAERRGLTTGQVVEKACQMAGESIETACICSKMGTALDRCTMDFIVSDACNDRLDELARAFDLSRDEVILRALILTRECLIRSN